MDAWRKDYNTRRPHQSLAMAYPAARFTPAADAIGLRVPAELTRQPPPSVPAPAPGPADSAARSAQDTGSGRQGQAVELDRLVPPSGNLWVAGQQIWLGPAMTGRTVRLWAGLTQVHVLLDGHRIKTLPPRLPEPLTVTRRVSVRGSVMVGGQKVQVGLSHARKTVQVTVGPDTYQVTVEPGITVTAARTTSRDIRRHKASNYG